MKHTVLVVNDIFEGENLLIIKSKGSQSVNRFEESITPSLLETELERNGISLDNCKVTVTSTDWKGNAKIEQY
jgi:hypothetical protein